MIRTQALVAKLTLVAVFIAACSPTKFTPVPVASTPPPQDSQATPVTPAPVIPAPVVPAPITPPECVNPPGVRLTKIMFLVDTSSSNTGFFGIGATDPQKKFRLGSIQKFFNKYKDKSNFEWGFMTFGGTTAIDYVGKNGVGSFAASSTMQEALDRFSSESDSGTTPYQAALSGAANAIARDPDNHTASNPQYFVVMITDGFPTDVNTLAQIAASVSKVTAADSGSSSLSTVYYGTQNLSVPSTNLAGDLENGGANMTDADAIALLKLMATMGSGQFANVNNPASGIDINDVLPPLNSGCPISN